VTAERDTHSQKHLLPSVSTEEGMQIDASKEQSENADAPIDERREPDSKVTVERAVHLQKQLLPSLSTEEGLQMDKSEKQSENAPSSTNER
jgi:hypothetical protein